MKRLLVLLAILVPVAVGRLYRVRKVTADPLSASMPTSVGFPRAALA